METDQRSNAKETEILSVNDETANRGHDLEMDDRFAPEFRSRSERDGFLRKLFALLSLQQVLLLIISILFECCLSNIKASLREKFFNRLIFSIILTVFFAIIYVTCIFVTNIRRKFPWTFLFISSVCLVYFLIISLCYLEQYLLLIFTIGSSSCFLLFIVATKIDVTQKFASLYFPIYIVAFTFVIPFISGIHYLYSALPAIIFTAFIIHIGYNCMAMLENRQLNLKRNEFPFASTHAIFGFDFLRKRLLQTRTKQQSGI